MPLEAPVTTATLLSSFLDMVSLLWMWEHTSITDCRTRCQRRNARGTARDPPDDVEEHRGQENAEERDAEHAGEDRRAQGAAHLGPCPAGDYQRKDAEDERQRGHDDRPQPHPCRLHRGVEE